jgi:hypothetical protein
MSKLIDEPIKVHQDKDSMVTAFIWRRRLYRVLEVLDQWREPAEWWNEEEMRLFFRVTAKNTGTGVYELCQISEKWFLSRVLD